MIMIIEEYLNDNTLIKRYSDKGFLLLQNETGLKYSEAIDHISSNNTYTETEELSESEEENED